MKTYSFQGFLSFYAFYTEGVLFFSKLTHCSQLYFFANHTSRRSAYAEVCTLDSINHFINKILVKTVLKHDKCFNYHIKAIKKLVIPFILLRLFLLFAFNRLGINSFFYRRNTVLWRSHFRYSVSRYLQAIHWFCLW